MTRRPGRPALFAAAAAAICASTAWLVAAGHLPAWDGINNAWQTVLALGVAYVALRDQDRDTAALAAAVAGLVRADPGVPDALAPDANPQERNP